MKLVTKISLAATLSLLLFSQILLWYLLFQNNQAMLETKVQLETQEMKNSQENLKRLLNTAGNLKEELNHIVMIHCFRQSFQKNSALYRGDTEIWNHTPYEFSQKQFWKENPKQSSLSEIYYLQTKAGGKRLLVMEQEVMFQNVSYQIFYYQNLDDIYQQIQRLLWEGIGISIGLIIILNLVLHFAVKKILQPFYELKRAANMISSGKYEERAVVRQKDEIGEVAQSFNRMAEKVQEHVRELSDLNESQRQMMGSLAHELKTPMTSIQGYAETLLRVRLSEEKKRMALQYIESESKRLSRLSGKMLELTGLYHSEHRLHFETIFLKELFEEAVKIFEARLSQKQMRAEIIMWSDDKQQTEWKTQKQDAEYFVNGEKDLLLSFLLNCMENGYRASAWGTKLVLGAETGKIWVQDFGIGIAQEEIERLTEAFYMVDRSRSRKEGGAGLGLALCKQIALLHHGAIKIESEKGKGTKVILEIETKMKTFTN